MYRHFIRPILFRFYPETVHSLVAGMLKTTWKIPGLSHLLQFFFVVKKSSLEKTIWGIKFQNQVGLAAGFDKKADLYNPFSMLGFGFIEIGTVTPQPQPGNNKPRSFRLPKDKALINRMGFNSIGLEATVANLKKHKPRAIIGGNIGKNTATPNENAIDDYVTCFKGLYNYVDYFVVNVSCPNVSNLSLLQDRNFLTSLMKELKNIRSSQSQTKPILLKISPDLSHEQLDEMIDIVITTKADGFVVSNTSTSRDGLQTEEEVVKEIGNGGLSGLPLRKKSTEIIRYISNKTQGKIPIIGCGGIFTPADAREKLEAGASLIQVYTGFIYEGPCMVKRILKNISNSNR